MRNNNKTKFIVNSSLEQFNPCPSCGRKAFALIEDSEKCQLGCIHCGVNKGVLTYEQGLNCEIEVQLREKWNYRFFEEEVCGDALIEMDIDFDGYGLVNSNDGHLEYSMSKFRGVLDYLRTTVVKMHTMSI